MAAARISIARTTRMKTPKFRFRVQAQAKAEQAEDVGAV
jgi:hypothetical protein